MAHPTNKTTGQHRSVLIATAFSALAILAIAATASASEPTILPLLRAGITPNTLATVGCDASDARAILAAVEVESAALAAFRAAQADLDEAERRLCDAEADLRRSGGADPADTRLASARQSVATASAAVDAARSALIAVVLDAASAAGGADRQTLALALTNAHRPVPDALKVLNLSEQDWAVLETAIQKQRAGGTLTPTESSLIQSATAHSAALDAAYRLSTNGPQVQQAFAAAMAQSP